MIKSLKKIISLLLIIGLNWVGLLAISETRAYFNDTEISEENIMAAGILDFELEGKGFNILDFAQNQTQIERIKLINNEDNLDFKYSVSVEITGGDSDFCDSLVLSVDFNGINIYIGSLNELKNDFDASDIPAPYFNNPDKWDFKITSQYPSIAGICKFDFVFQARQENLSYGNGFSDEGKIGNIISTGATTCGAANHLVINEVQIKGDDNTKHDFVEIYNPTNLDINLNDYEGSYVRLVKRTKTGTIDTTLKSWSVGGSAIVPAYGYYLWASSGDGNYPAIIGADASTTQMIAADNAVALRKGPQNTGTIIDATGWGLAANALVEINPYPDNPENNQSIERGLTGYDSNNNSIDFIIKNNPTPTNSIGDGMPDIVINEFLASGENFDNFIELYNRSDSAIDLTDWMIKVENNTTYTRDLKGEIKSKDWLLIECSDEDILQADGVITLYNNNSPIPDEIDKISYHNAITPDSSFARIPDGSANWVDPVPTPGKINTTPENLALAGLNLNDITNPNNDIQKTADVVEENLSDIDDADKEEIDEEIVDKEDEEKTAVDDEIIEDEEMKNEKNEIEIKIDDDNSDEEENDDDDEEDVDLETDDEDVETKDEDDDADMKEEGDDEEDNDKDEDEDEGGDDNNDNFIRDIII